MDSNKGKDRSNTLKVYPYQAHEWPQETLAVLCGYAQRDHQHSLMWRTGTPVALNDWILWFTSPTRLVLLAVEEPPDRVRTPDDIIGMGWIDEIEHPRGTGHFWFRKQSQMCRKPLEAGAKTLDLLFSPPYSFQTLVIRPNAENKVSVKFARHLGFQMIGEIPGWYGHGEVRYPASIGYMTAAMWAEKRGRHGGV